MADQNRISGLDSMQVAAFLDTGDAAALDAWKREHPDWFVAGDWNPSPAPLFNGGAIDDRLRPGTVPTGRSPGETDQAWSHASPMDTRDPAFSLADFNAVAARARQDASQAPAEATPVRDTLRAAADGFGRGFGQEPIGLGAPARGALQRAGIMAPPDGGGSLLQNLNSGLIDAVAVPVDAVVRTAAGLLGAYQAGVAEAGNAIGQPQLGRDLAALPEAFPFGFRDGIPKPENSGAGAVGSKDGGSTSSARVNVYPLLDLPPRGCPAVRGGLSEGSTSRCQRTTSRGHRRTLPHSTLRCRSKSGGRRGKSHRASRT